MTDEYQKVFNGDYGSYMEYPQGENDKILGGLCYIFGWIVSLIVLIAIKPCSPFLRFHALQALGLSIITMALSMVVSIGSMFIVGLCFLPFLMAIGVYALIIGIMVLIGNDHRVPMLGDYIESNFV